MTKAKVSPKVVDPVHTNLPELKRSGDELGKDVPLTVLIAHEKDDFTSSVARILKLSGYNVVSAKEPYEAIDKINTGKPEIDILLMQQESAEISGVDAVKIASQVTDTSKMKTIILTSEGVDRNKVDPKLIHKILDKPVDADKVLTAVQEVSLNKN